jgi:WD40 repeat protein
VTLTVDSVRKSVVADVFISYSRRDKEFVSRLHDRLEASGRSTWVDWEGIPPSAEWLREIYAAIEAGDAFLFVISGHSVVSQVCAAEIAHAVKHHKRLIPVLREKVADDVVPAAIRERNWLAFVDDEQFDGSYATLVVTLDTDLDWIKAHTRLLTRAIEWDANRRDRAFDLRGSDLRRAEMLVAEASLEKDPPLTVLQTAYVLASRRDTDRRQRTLLGSVAVALLVLLGLGMSWWHKRQENILISARNLHEGALSALANNDPLEAEVLAAHALRMADRRETRELLLQARAQAPQLVATLPVLAGAATTAFSPDGSRYAAASENRVEIRDLTTRSLVRTVPARGTVLSAALSDDNRVLALGYAKSVELWALDGSPAGAPEIVLSGAETPAALVFARDGSRLAAGGRDRVVTIWPLGEGETGPALRLSGHADQIDTLDFSRDGRFLASGSWDNHVKLWDVAAGQELHTLLGHEDAVLSVAFSPDGKLVASGSWDNRIWLWDAATGTRLRVLQGSLGGITQLAFSPDGLRLASASEDRTARLWDVATGRSILSMHSHDGEVTGVAFLGPSNHPVLAVADDAGSIREWAVTNLGERDEVTTLRGHEGPVSTVAFSPDGKRLATGSWDKHVVLWDLQENRPVGNWPAHQDNILSVKFSPDGRLIATTSKDKTVQLRDPASGEVTWLGGKAGLGTTIRDIVFSPDGHSLILAGDDGTIRVWSLTEDREISRIEAHGDKILGLALNGDGTMLASAGEDGLVRLWDTSRWAARDLRGHTKTVWAVAFSPDGRYLVSGSDDRTARLWDTGSGKEAVTPLQHEGSVWSVDFSPDGQFIAAGGQDSSVRLWRVDLSQEAAKVEQDLTLHLCEGPVWWVRFNRDAAAPVLAIGSADKTARLFKLTEARSLLSNAARLEAEAEGQTGLRVVQDQLEFHIVADKEGPNLKPAALPPAASAQSQ